ncbi:RND transporter [Haloechinothrix salitolerans]|uniref:RND transporter n=1 Tax=Haloechinothrix salitolerans TaxID=926830 RepID=A0ABW2BX01_9PSEU
MKGLTVLRRLRRPRLPSRRVAAGVAAAMVVAVAVIGGLLQTRVETGASSFLPTDDPAMETLREVERSFGGDPVVVLLEDKENKRLLEQPRLSKVLRLEGSIASLPDVASVYGPATTLNQIAGRAQDFIAELAGRRDGVRAQAVSKAREAGASGNAAEAAGERAVAKFDQRYGSLLAEAMPMGMPTLSNPRFVNSVVFEKDGLPRPQWSFLVPNRDAIAILVRPAEGVDAQATSALVGRVEAAVSDAQLDTRRTTVSGVPTVAAALGNEVLTEIPVLAGLAVIGVGACLLLVRWAPLRRRLVPLGVTLAAVAITVSLFGWLQRPLSLGVIAFLSVLLGVGSYYMTYFTHRVRSRTVFVVASATAASFATLALSPLPFVRDLGLTLAFGVLTSTFIGWVVMRGMGTRTTQPDNAERRTGTPRRRSSLVVVAGAFSAVAAAVGWAVLPAIPVESDVSKLAAGLPALEEAEHAREVMHSSGEIRIALTGNDVLTRAGYEWMRTAQQQLVRDHGDVLRPALSLPKLLTFLGADPTEQQLAAGANLLPPYLVGAVLSDDQSTAVLSFGIETNDVAEIARIHEKILDTLPPPPESMRADVTGIPIVGVRANELISGDRVWINLAGILAAGTVLALGLRRRADAVRAVTAAVIATGAGFLLLWASGIAFNPVTVALGSLTAAVACEFTVLLAAAARQGNELLRRAVALAAMASAVGYVVLLVSRIALIREFGMLLGVTVALAFAASAVVVTLTVRDSGADDGTTADDDDDTNGSDSSAERVEVGTR